MVMSALGVHPSRYMRKFQNKGLELFAMVFSRIPLIFLAVFLWQSLAMLGSTNIAQRAGDLDHMVALSQDANHHHHADHSLHNG